MLFLVCFNILGLFQSNPIKILSMAIRYLMLDKLGQRHLKLIKNQNIQSGIHFNENGEHD